jgi:prepilin-type N-terminal cleavage/methylation domain-containing protein
MNLTLTGIGRSERRTADAGVTLVELLVATVIAAVTLCGAWAWLWNVGVVSSATVDRTHAATEAAFAARCISDDLDVATALQVPPSAYGPDRALDLTHLHPGAAPEGVLIVWDPSRRVLWRKASGTYLAEHVTRFAVTYYDGGGAALTPVDLEASAWPSRVVRVAVEVVVAAGSETARAGCDVTLGQR